MFNVITPPGQSRWKLTKKLMRLKVELAVLEKLPFKSVLVEKRKEAIQQEIERIIARLRIVYL